MSELNIPGFIAFLRGEVTIDGHWFGGDGPIRGGIRRNFWWREHLPKLSAHIERQDAEIAQLRADLSESRRLLDEARNHERAFRCRLDNAMRNERTAFDARMVDLVRRLATYPATRMDELMAADMRAMCRDAIAIYDAAPVPAQPASKPLFQVAVVDGSVESFATHGSLPDGQYDLYSAVNVQPAAVPEAVAKDAIPAGWVFYSADASIQSSDPRRPMAAMIKRDVDGVQWWLQLTEEEKEATPLYSSGAGMTLTLAIQNAVAAILSAADTEVKK